VLSEQTEEIDWENPPATPEDLDNDWEETTHSDNTSGNREFTNKKTVKE